MRKPMCGYCGAKGHAEAECTIRQLDEHSIRSARRRDKPLPTYLDAQGIPVSSGHQTVPGRISFSTVRT